MIAVPAGIRVLVATKPVDFRRGADSLVALVREQLKHDPFSGTIFVFGSKRADRLKIVAWDGSGLVLLELSLGLRSFGLSFLRFCLGTLGIGPRRLCLSLLGTRRRT
jgi:transposase